MNNQEVSINDVAFIIPTYSLLPWILLRTMQRVSINDVAFPIAPYHTYLFSISIDSTMNNQEVSINNVAFIIPTYSLLPWILLRTMQRVSINDVVFPIAPYHTYLFYISMDSTMNNAACKYQ